MRIYIYLFFLLSSGLFYTCMLDAQVYTLTGKVLDKATGKSLPGASVYLPEIKKGTIANKDLVCLFKGLITYRQIYIVIAMQVIANINLIGY